MILILSNKRDLTVDFIVSELRRRNYPFLRLNTETLIDSDASIRLPDFSIALSRGNTVYDLTQVKAVWYRRPGKPFDDTREEMKPPPQIQQFVTEQWWIWIEALQLFPEITWVNHPENNNRMENKVRQLLLASQIGFRIPDTLVSNAPRSIYEHIVNNNGNIVVKALYAPLIENEDQDFFIFTNKISSDDILGADEELRISPSIFQQCLSPKNDYRITVVGNVVFPVKINYPSNQETSIDWRTIKDDIDFELVELPPDIEKKCVDYVKAAGLIFGAIDMIEYQGKFYFIEINPNGEWGWLQKPHNIPIAKTLCDLLVSYDDETNN